MSNDFVLILDFGGIRAQSIAKKLRGQSYYCEIRPHSIDAEAVTRKSPKGILLVGKANEASPAFDARILKLSIPVLAIGDVSRLMAQALGAQSEGALLTGRATQITFHPCPLFEGLSESDRYFERIDALKLPEGIQPIATTIDGLAPAFANIDKRLYGLQFYPESNDPDGAHILANFAGNICGCKPFWTPEYYIHQEVEYIRNIMQDRDAIMSISGGVDSTVCAMLMHKAIGDRLKCMFINTGLLRKGEVENVEHTFREQLGLNLEIIDARDRMLNALRGVISPAEKRHRIHEVFINTLNEQAAQSGASVLVKGTIYSDLLKEYPEETGDSPYKLIEPIRMLFKDEVRFVGEALGIPRALLARQPFPGSGLAIRCLGEVTAEKLSIVREADAIFRSEIIEAGLDKRLSLFFAILTDVQLPSQSEGASEYACVLRAANISEGGNVSIAKLPYDLLDRVVSRITTQIPSINHVLYDVTSTPTATAEWE